MSHETRERGDNPSRGRRVPARDARAWGRALRPGAVVRTALGAAGVALALAVLAPYLVMVLTALKPEAELRTIPPRLFPQSWRVENFGAVLGDPEFLSWLSVSLIVAAGSTALAVGAAVPAAYHTARRAFP